MLTLRDIMRTDLVTVTPDTSVETLVELLTDRRVSGVPVVDEGGEVVGVVSATDVLAHFSELTAAATGESRPQELLGASAEDWSEWAEAGALAFLPQPRAWSVTVSEIMTPIAYTLSPDTPVREAAGAMYRGAMHRVLVTEGGRLVGIVTTTDIVKAVADGRLVG
jgi:CBS domain-containing protein